MKLTELVKYLNSYLDIANIPDSSYNGLQLERNDEVNKVAFAVDACVDSFNHAVAYGADLVIVHHGIFWSFTSPALTKWNRQRVDVLIDNNVSLYAAHLPLDRNKEIGNNVELLRLFDAEITEPFLFKDKTNIGWIGKAKKPWKLADIEDRLNKELKTQSTVIPFGNPEVSTIAACSGGGGYDGFWAALDAEVDLYLSGDTVAIFQTAKDARMNVVFSGHYATETLGMKALAKHLHDKFGLETEFIDLPTGL